MANFGEWLKEVPPLRAAIGLILLIAAASFSLGMAANNLVGLPGKVASLETQLLASDSLEHSRWGDMALYFVADSIYKWKTTCILEKIVTGQPLGRFDCDPGATGGANP